jgi:hypothetical protein
VNCVVYFNIVGGCAASGIGRSTGRSAATPHHCFVYQSLLLYSVVQTSTLVVVLRHTLHIIHHHLLESKPITSSLPKIVVRADTAIDIC